MALRHLAHASHDFYGREKVKNLARFFTTRDDLRVAVVEKRNNVFVYSTVL